MSVLPNVIFRFNAGPIKAPVRLVRGCPHTGPGVDTQGQRPEEPAQSWRTAIVQVQDLV